MGYEHSDTEGSKGLQLPSSHIFDRIDSYNSSQRMGKIFLQRVCGGPLFLANEVHLHYKSTAHADFVLLFVQTEQRDRFVKKKKEKKEKKKKKKKKKKKS